MHIYGVFTVLPLTRDSSESLSGGLVREINGSLEESLSGGLVRIALWRPRRALAALYILVLFTVNPFTWDLSPYTFRVIYGVSAHWDLSPYTFPCYLR